MRVKLPPRRLPLPPDERRMVGLSTMQQLCREIVANITSHGATTDDYRFSSGAIGVLTAASMHQARLLMSYATRLALHRGRQRTLEVADVRLACTLYRLARDDQPLLTGSEAGCVLCEVRGGRGGRCHLHPA